jgi:hypothetical protein
MHKKIAGLLSAFLVLGFLSAAHVCAQKVEDLSLDVVYKQFREAIKGKCGERSEAIRLGKHIVEKYANDELNKAVVDFVKRRTAVIEKEDAACRRAAGCGNAFSSKNWQKAFECGSDIIVAEGENSSLGLDLMLDLVSIGYDRAAVDKSDAFNADTLRYAKLSIQQIEAGRNSATGKFGVYFPFNTKDDALAWMNYITGWLMYYKLNQRKDALVYFYIATQTGTAKKYDPTIYTNIASYYFDEAVRLESEYREKKKANKYQDTDETRSILTLARAAAERSMFYFARAYKIAAADPRLRQLKANIRKTLKELYRFRLNLNPDYEPDELDLFIDDLNEKPLPDLKTPPEKPVLEEPLEIRLKRLKLQ